MGQYDWLKNSPILQRAVEFAGDSEFSQSRNNAIVDALLAAAAYLREYHNAAQATFTEKQEFIDFLKNEDKKLREAVQSVEQHYLGLLATARQEAFEQMAQYWESRGCKTEAREARRMAKELGL